MADQCCDEPAFVCVSCGDDHKCDAARLRAALEIIAGPPESSPYAIPVEARNIARAALDAAKKASNE